MPQSEMEALIQLQKETIESLRQLVDSHGCLRDVPEICEQHSSLPPGGGLETAGSETLQSDTG